MSKTPEGQPPAPKTRGRADPFKMGPAPKNLFDLIGGIASVERRQVSEAVKRLSEAKPGDIQEIAASQIELLSSYYQLALEQQRKSFKWALIAAGFGLICFFTGAAFLIYSDLKSVALIGTISGTTVQIISGIQFYLYAQTTKQLAGFHTRLDATQRFLLANSVCESLHGETKDKARHELVQVIAGIKNEDKTARQPSPEPEKDEK